MSTFLIRFRLEADGPLHTVKGRDAWALDALWRAKERGVTPLDVPGPRWSAYIHKLRNLGLSIETIHEPHAGPFRGTHARYVLRTTITIDDSEAHGTA